MRITTHYRENPSPRFGFLNDSSYKDEKSGKTYSPMLCIDKFFEQPHNKRYGWISTNPELADNPSSFGHFNPFDGQTALPSDMPASEIHGMVVSKDCQSFSELSSLKRLRPNEADYQDTSIDVPPEPAPAEPAPAEYTPSV